MQCSPVGWYVLGVLAGGVSAIGISGRGLPPEAAVLGIQLAGGSELIAVAGRVRPAPRLRPGGSGRRWFGGAGCWRPPGRAARALCCVGRVGGGVPPPRRWLASRRAV